MTKVAVVQMCSTEALDPNLQAIADFVEQAAVQGAQLVLLPENCAFLGLHEMDKLKLQEPLGTGPIQDMLAKLAQQHNIWIIAGTLPISLEKNAPGYGEKVYACSIVYDANGDRVAHYNKIHLFDVCVSDTESHKESNAIQAGKTVQVVETPVGKIGLSVCYDLRFPELYRAAVEQGAELLTVPSAFTETTGKVHWDILLRARAVENLCYVLAADQSGRHNPHRVSYGHSMIVEPWGEVAAQIAHDPGVIVANIDLQALHSRRELFPAIEHRCL